MIILQLLKAKCTLLTNNIGQSPDNIEFALSIILVLESVHGTSVMAPVAIHIAALRRLVVNDAGKMGRLVEATSSQAMKSMY